MKKIITLVSVIAFAVAANAKTSAELAAEYAASVKAGNTEWDAAIEVYQNNSADVATLFESWKPPAPLSSPRLTKSTSL